ncbi:response regulator transcription factor [Nocardioides mesophilus]|uniref:Response regulator transcription factor n=1 Tax=Nocardioides mesophilus TaxID=433659 RepID=A0A7G9RH06_9ACTN|nr:response regulator transcription factor [Nocardioides mesophilus]
MRIGVCEDDASIRRVLTEGLRYAGHDVVAAHDGAEAMRLFTDDPGLEVIVLDIGLPDADGRDVCAALRAAGQRAPVLFLTAYDAMHDRLSGFHAGGDDYVTKPFDIREVLVRLAALARRSAAVEPPAQGLRLDPDRHALRMPDAEVLLTPTEYRILAAIAARPGEVVRRRAVVAAAWPDGAMVSENTVDTYLSRVRRKLEEVGSPVTVHTVRGVGFVLR